MHFTNVPLKLLRVYLVPKDMKENTPWCMFYSFISCRRLIFNVLLPYAINLYLRALNVLFCNIQMKFDSETEA
jgi:hypothetical protein